MRLDEIANSQFDKVFQVAKSNKAWKYAFQTNDGTLVTAAIELETPEVMNVGFSTKSKGSKEFTVKATGNSNPKDVAKIIGTIRNLVEKFLKEYKAAVPKEIKFAGSTTEQNRIGLYDMIAKRVGDWFPDYEFSHTSELNGNKVYHFTRIQINHQKLI